MTATSTTPSLSDAMIMLTGRLFGRAVSLALLCVIVQIGLGFVASALVPASTSVPVAAPFVMIVLAHCVFVVALTHDGVAMLRGERTSFARAIKVGVAGGMVLLWPALLLLMPLTLGPGYVSVEAHDAPWSIADLPWLLIAWTVVAALALPARIVARARGERFVVHRPWKMALPIAPWLVIVALTGYPAQNCRGECWGLFEGGMVTIPLLGLHLFLASFSCALLSALAVVVPRQAESPTA